MADRSETPAAPPVGRARAFSYFSSSTTRRTNNTPAGLPAGRKLPLLSWCGLVSRGRAGTNADYVVTTASHIRALRHPQAPALEWLAQDQGGEPRGPGWGHRRRGADDRRQSAAENRWTKITRKVSGTGCGQRPSPAAFDGRTGRGLPPTGRGPVVVSGGPRRSSRPPRHGSRPVHRGGPSRTGSGDPKRHGNNGSGRRVPLSGGLPGADRRGDLGARRP